MDILAELDRPLIERLDGRICVSEACIGSLTPYFPYAYDVIPNGIDTRPLLARRRARAELMGDHQNIVFVGRFDPRNGLDTMIDAYQLLYRRARASGAAGRGRRRPAAQALRRQVGEPRAPYVHFAGRLNRSRPNYLVSGDVFCTPCNRASFGMVLLEAMSCGRAVVASRICGFQLLMEHGMQGYLVHPADFAGAVRRGPGAAARRSRPARADGRARAAARRSNATRGHGSAAQLETYYSDLIAGRRPSWASARSSASS